MGVQRLRSAIPSMINVAGARTGDERLSEPETLRKMLNLSPRASLSKYYVTSDRLVTM
jgi:hypothetical protein